MMRSTTTDTQTDVRMLTIHGQRLKVAIRRSDGTRTPLLLMNGIGANLELLQPFVDQLDPAIEVIRFDVPGVGGSPVPALPHRFSSLAWLAKAMLDQLGYRQVDVLGISWGGALAQQFAFYYPRVCRKLVLVSTGTGALMVPGRLSALVKLITPRRYMDPTYMERVAPSLYGGDVRAHPELLREFTRAVRSGGPRGYFYQMVVGMGWTSLPWLPLLRQPTLILAGDDDRIVPTVNARIMGGLIPHAQVHIFHGGHLGLVTEARELAPLISRFLGDGKTPASGEQEVIYV